MGLAEAIVPWGRALVFVYCIPAAVGPNVENCMVANGWDVVQLRAWTHKL